MKYPPVIIYRLLRGSGWNANACNHWSFPCQIYLCTMTSSLASMNGRAQMLPNYRQLMPPTAKVFTSQDGDVGVVGNVPLHKSREIANSNNM